MDKQTHEPTAEAWASFRRVTHGLGSVRYWALFGGGIITDNLGSKRSPYFIDIKPSGITNVEHKQPPHGLFY